MTPTIKDLTVYRSEDKNYTMTLTADVDLTGLTGLDIQFAIKGKVVDTDYINHKDLGPATLATVSLLTINKQLTYTSKTVGVEGNDISVTYTDPGAINQTLSVSVVTTDTVRNSAPITNYNIIVSLATDGAGAITSTANLIKSAIEANTPANALVTIAVPGTGADVVTAVSQTYLTGGLSGGITLIGATGKVYKVTIPQDEIFLIPDGPHVYDSLIDFSGSNRIVVLNGSYTVQTGVSE
ncbi:hypothetical protein LCGC14_2071910 [marine sediment metagenome]|uniref:Uncharacterized protein n=1 Tax=marine sediment metagenome TaxID=412755 RepID=A0A0F9GWI4_9ZZZZ